MALRLFTLSALLLLVVGLSAAFPGEITDILTQVDEDMDKETDTFKADADKVESIIGPGLDFLLAPEETAVENAGPVLENDVPELAPVVEAIETLGNGFAKGKGKAKGQLKKAQNSIPKDAGVESVIDGVGQAVENIEGVNATATAPQTEQVVGEKPKPVEVEPKGFFERFFGISF